MTKFIDMFVKFLIVAFLDTLIAVAIVVWPLFLFAWSLYHYVGYLALGLPYMSGWQILFYTALYLSVVHYTSRLVGDWYSNIYTGKNDVNKSGPHS